MKKELSFRKYEGEYVIALISGESPIEGELVEVGEELIELKGRAIIKKKKVKGLLLGEKMRAEDSLNIDQVMTGISASQRSRIIKIREIIENLEKEFGEEIPIPEILDRAEDKGIDKCEEVLDKMEREGEIFEPREDVIKRVEI